jgi:hypothetical protein
MTASEAITDNWRLFCDSMGSDCEDIVSDSRPVCGRAGGYLDPPVHGWSSHFSTVRVGAPDSAARPQRRAERNESGGMRDYGEPSGR